MKVPVVRKIKKGKNYDGKLESDVSLLNNISSKYK